MTDYEYGLIKKTLPCKRSFLGRGRDKEYYNLQSLGYQINGITHAESFDDSYQYPNPIFIIKILTVTINYI